MKKFLALVLALVMTMSLVTISAGAKDFADAADVTYTEAVDVMTAIGVVDGDTAGNFNPTNGLTRGAAAKIICNLILGPTTAAELNADTNPYVDVDKDSVFAGYIAYCAKEGIVSGYADGTFKPAAPLTGYAFMKMLLGALGYDADVEGYTGANWSINVAKRAIGIGLNDGLKTDFNGSDFVTREEAMLYAFNTLKSTMVEYKNSSTIVVGDITVQTNSTASEVEQAAKYDTIKSNERTEFAEKYFAKLKLTNTFNDDFMRPAHEWKYGKTVIGLYTNTPDAVYTAAVKGKVIYADLGAAYDLEGYYVDGASVSAPAGFEVAKNNNVSHGANGLLTEAYIIEGDDDTDDTVRLITVCTYVAVVDDDYDADDEDVEITFADNCDLMSDATLKLDDWAMIKDLKEDDVLLVTVSVIDGFNKAEIKSIELAETFTEAVTEFESNWEAAHEFNPKDNVTAGDNYTYAKYFATSIEGFNGAYVIDDEYDFYLDNYGYVIYVEGVTAAEQYVYIDAFEVSGLSTKMTAKAYAYFVDGTSALIPVTEITVPAGYDGSTEKEVIKLKGVTALEAVAGLNGLFTYTEKDGKYALTVVETNDVPMVEAQAMCQPEFLDGNGKLVIADALDFAGNRGSKNTVFIVIDEDDDVEVYTGIKNVPEIVLKSDIAEDAECGYMAWTADSDSKLYAKYVFIDLGDEFETEGRAKGGDVLFLYENDYAKKGTDAKKNVYHTYKVLKDGEATTVKFDSTATDLDAGLYIGVKYDDNGYACKWTKIEGASYAPYNNPEDYSFDTYGANASVEKKGDVITIWEGEHASNGYYMADDCAVTFVVDEEIDNVSWKKIDGVEFEVDAIWGVMNSDGDYVELYFALTELD